MQAPAAASVQSIVTTLRETVLAGAATTAAVRQSSASAARRGEFMRASVSRSRIPGNWPDYESERPGAPRGPPPRLPEHPTQLRQVVVGDVRFAAQTLCFGYCVRAVPLDRVTCARRSIQVFLLELIGLGSVELLRRRIDAAPGTAASGQRGSHQ
jgi:hypothetical protein